MRIVNDFDIAKKYISLMKSANDRGIEFNLSLTSVKNLLSAKKCFYSGVKLNDNVGSPHQRTVDRIDNSKGYIKGNVSACCHSINIKKNNLTIKEIEMIYNGVRRK